MRCQFWLIEMMILLDFRSQIVIWLLLRYNDDGYDFILRKIISFIKIKAMKILLGLIICQNLDIN